MFQLSKVHLCLNQRVLVHLRIVQRLREAGWDKEIDYAGPDRVEELSEVPIVSRAEKLDDAGNVLCHYHRKPLL